MSVNGQLENKRYFRALLRACFALLLVSMTFKAKAQGLEQMVFTAGTTTRDAAGRTWAYILWQGLDHNPAANRVYVVYAKPGAADSSELYVRKGIVRLQTDPRVLQPLLARAVNLGEDLPSLSLAIYDLFGGLSPTNNVASQLSAVIRGSLNDQEQFDNLVHFGLAHPGVNLCLGSAYAQEIDPSRPTTFEIREFNLAQNRDLAVIGRVTLDPAASTLLPAPGAPVSVPDATPKGDLNVRLRWVTPNDLRRVSLLQYGFNVYRMPKSFAETSRFHLTPPVTAALLALARSNTNVVRVNRLPILNEIDYDEPGSQPGGASDFTPQTGDIKTYFIADDNGRFESANARYGGIPFRNGEQFYYFVTARDLLGRDGLVSPGTLVTVCDRMPPVAPEHLRVQNEYSYAANGPRQFLKITWDQNENTPGETNVNYYVYRWESLIDLNRWAARPLTNRISGPIQHRPGQRSNSFVDQDAGAPRVPADLGKTYWYTVRAEDAGACGSNLSTHSSPAFGVLRDRTGPDAPTGQVEIQCVRPVVNFKSTANIPEPSSATNKARYRITCQRDNPAILWVEFYSGDPAKGGLLLSRQRYADGANTLSAEYEQTVTSPSPAPIFYCRVTDAAGKASNTAESPPGQSPKSVETRVYSFQGTVRVEQAALTGDCDTHQPRLPGVDILTPIRIRLFFTPGTTEWKLYRRLDDGPISMVAQGIRSSDLVPSIEALDNAMPPNAATLCYYAQYFDEHGNPSSLALLYCVRVRGTRELPVPVLNPLLSSGTRASPTADVRWFCSPYGVERFEVWIAANPPGLPAHPSGDLSDAIGDPVDFTTQVRGVDLTQSFTVFRTGRVGGNFTNGPLFSLKMRVDRAKTYTVFVKAIGPEGAVGERSNAEQILWRPPVTPDPLVPWPARELPPIGASFHPKIEAKQLPDDIFRGVGIRIGEVTLQSPVTAPPYPIQGASDPIAYLYKSPANGQNLFPVAVYRRQSPNANYPKVSGDLIQVTPLMEKIAFQKVDDQTRIIHDPFIVLLRPSLDKTLHEIFLLDTQPLLEGAGYQYFLVRFHSNWEIEQIIPTNEIEVRGANP